jgi:heterodisulfide reductase subunit A2
MKESVSMSEKNNGNEDQSATLRIGVFICDCGSNIAGHLDCKAVTEYASTLPDVVYAKENLYTCSESGIAEIQNAVKEQNLNRVLVASCSPRTHQPLFSSSCAQAGLNPYLFEMANIRDQCSWVHMGLREDATEKAKNLVRMGVAKSRFLEPQQDIEGDITPRAMVVGGGLAGMSAAESLAGMGLETILVEREPELGGLLNHISELAPEGDKAADRVSALVDSLKSLPNLTIYTASELKDISGYIGNFEATVESKDGKTFQEKIGSIVMATGAVPFKPEGMYGYDGKRVITQMELENLIEAGAVNAEKVVMIQCVGARSPEREYCSRICCMTAVKNARLIKRQNPQAEILILYRDIQMYGTKKEQMLWDARSEGIAFDVYTEDRAPVVEDGTVRYHQSLMGEDMAIPCDLVVLSTPLVAREDAAHFSQLLRVPIDQNNFFLEAHAKLRPLDFATDGIFVCGSARYPATTEEARSQGFGVAARVASILFKDKLVISALVAKIDAETCVGCKGCMEMCPYDAISYSAEKNICEVNEILCKGCGACAATCPSQSALLKGFKPQQLLSQIRAA